MKKPKPLKGNNPGYQRPPRQKSGNDEPLVIGVVRDVTKGAEHRGHQVANRVKDVIDKLNPFD